jgi:hypothetical protein
MKFYLFSIIIFLVSHINLLFSQSNEFKISPDDLEAGDDFGIAVDISKDFAVIGARWDDDNGESSGAVYVYTKIGTDWSFQQKITAEDGVAGAYFGSSVAVDGAVFVVGAPRDNATDEGSGAAYVFQYDSLMQRWVQIKKLVPQSDTSAYNEFGTAVAIAGSHIAVGAVGDHDYAGTLYLFQWEDSLWLMQSQLTAQDPTPNASFGFSLAMDLDRLLVGAPFGADGGAAYLFQLEDTLWVQKEKLTIISTATNPTFGYAVSILGDYALIGASGDQNDLVVSGAAYIFNREGEDWRQTAKLTDQAGFDGEELGFSVALSQDFALLGARLDNDNGGSSGSVFVFSGEGSDWYEQTKLVASDGNAGDMFGYSLAMNNEEVVVGAPGNGGTGAVYSYSDWIAVGFDQREKTKPHQFMLSQNYPNPFNNATMINYQLSMTGQVELNVYNVQGQKVVPLVSQRQPAGHYQVHWDAAGFASGIYICRLQAGSHIQSRKMLLMR